MAKARKKQGRKKKRSENLGEFLMNSPLRGSGLRVKHVKGGVRELPRLKPI